MHNKRLKFVRKLTGSLLRNSHLAERYLKMERVYTVPDWYDGPRGDVADCQGKPHYFESDFSDFKDEYIDTFQLSPIDEETFKIALEGWEIWERWRKAYFEGKVDIDSHSALPEDRNRKEELGKLLKNKLKIDPKRSILADADFLTDPERKKPYQQPFSLLVEWKKLSDNQSLQVTGTNPAA